VPFYHVISDEALLHPKYLFRHKAIEAFKKDLDFLLASYHPIALRRVLECRNAHCPLPDKCFLLTFDDGYREMSDVVAPILLVKGVNATFFVNSAFVDNKDLCYASKASLLVERLKREKSANVEWKLFRLLRSYNIHSTNLTSAILNVPYNRRALLEDMATVLGADFPAYLS